MYQVLQWWSEIWKNSLLNLINHQSVIDKIHLYEKDPYEPKYQLLTMKYEERGIKYFIDPTAFIKYSKDIKHR